MVVGDVGLFVAVVALELAECPSVLLDDLDTKCPVIFDLPAEFVTVVYIELSTDTSGDICLIPRHLALGVDVFTAHTQLRWSAYLNTSVPTHYSAYLVDIDSHCNRPRSNNRAL